MDVLDIVRRKKGTAVKTLPLRLLPVWENNNKWSKILTTGHIHRGQTFYGSGDKNHTTLAGLDPVSRPTMLAVS